MMIFAAFMAGGLLGFFVAALFGGRGDLG